MPSSFKVLGGDQKQYGPVTESELRQWIAEGRLNAQSLVLLEGGGEWRPIGSFPEYVEALRGSGALPPATESPKDWAQKILAREPEFSIGDCLSGGFSFLGANFGFIVVAVFVVWALNLMMAFIPFIGGIVHLLLSGVLMAGLYVACLKRMRGDSAGVEDVFSGFKLNWPQLMVTSLVSKILIQFGLVLCVLPGLYLMVAWIFALPLVLDKKLEFWSAMELSRKVVTRVWIPMFLLLALVFIPMILAQGYAMAKVYNFIMELLQESNYDPARILRNLQAQTTALVAMSLKVALVTQVTLLLNLIFGFGVLVRAYENLFGARKS